MPGGYSISGLGGFGLDPSGAFSDYSSMMGMSPYGATMGMSPYGMMGMSPAFMGQMAEMQKYMAEIQHQQQKSQLDHTQQMHSLIQQAEVNNLSAHDRAIFEKAMVDGDIKEGVRNLANVIRKGDQDAICEEYDKLKMSIYTKYSDYFQSADKNKNSFANVNNLIRTLYAQIVSAQTGQYVDLENDINRYGETAFMHGFNKTFLGKKGHNEKYSEETVNYLFGTRINDKGSKDRTQKIGGWCARGAEGLSAGVAGYLGALGLAGITKFAFPSLATSLEGLHKFGKWGALAAIGADIFWQISRD